MPFKSHAAKYIVHIPLQTHTHTHMRTDEITFHISIHYGAHIESQAAKELICEEMDPPLVFEMQL